MVMIFGMYQEMFSFLVVFVMSILGFGIAFHSLFSEMESFKSPGRHYFYHYLPTSFHAN